jgi:DNA polymerase-1
MNTKMAFGITKSLETFIVEADKKGLKGKDRELFILKKELSQIKEENPEERDASKSISFGILYRMSCYGLKFDLDKKTRKKGRVWTVKECQGYIDGFNKGYAKLSRYLLHLIDFATKHGYTYNLFGFRRWLPDIKSPDKDLRKKALNSAVNTPIQGGSNCIMMCGMYDIYRKIDRTRARLTMTVHDSVVAEVREDYVQEYCTIAQSSLETPTFKGKLLPFLNIPIVADLQMGPSYGELTDLINVDGVWKLKPKN